MESTCLLREPEMIAIVLALAFTVFVLFFQLLEAWAISQEDAYLEQKHCAYDQLYFMTYGI
jgi:hypothetical protein